MTPSVTNGHRHELQLHTADPAGQALETTDPAPRSARARAITPVAEMLQHDLAIRARNSVSSHAGDVKDAVASAPVTVRLPITVAEAARLVLPAKGECGNPATWLWAAAAGLLRLALIAYAWALAHAVTGSPDPDTGRPDRRRAGIALAVLLVLTVTSITLSVAR